MDYLPLATLDCMLKRLHFGYDSTRGILAVATGPQKLQLWRTADAPNTSGQPRGPDLELSTERSKIVGVHLQPGGLLVTIHETGAIAAWTVADNESLSAELAWEQSVSFTPSLVASTRAERGRVAIAGKLGDLAIIELDDQDATLIALAGHNDEITALCFDDGGARLATGARDHNIQIWGTDALSESDEDAEPLQLLDGCESWPLTMSFSSDGRRLAAGAMDNGVYLWAIEGDDESELVGCVFEHHGWIVDVEWAPDDSVVAAASWDNTIGIYGRERLRPRFSFEYHRDYVSALCFVGDDLYSGGYDQNVCRWMWRDAEFGGVVEAHDDWVLAMVELDGRRVATLASDKTVRIWQCPQFELVETLGDGVTGSFDLGASVDMSSFVDGGDRASEQLDDKRPPHAEMPPGRIDAVRKLDASKTSASAKTAFGMLESQLDHSTLDADSAFDPDADIELADSDSVTAEYDSEAELASAAADFTSEADDAFGASDDGAAAAPSNASHEAPDASDETVTQADKALEDASTREVDPEEVDPSIFDLGGDMEDAPELDVDSGALTTDSDDVSEGQADDAFDPGLDIEIEDAPDLDFDSEELADATDDVPSELGGAVDLEGGPEVDLDIEIDSPDPEEITLDVDDAAPPPESRAEKALEEESAGVVEPDVEPDDVADAPEAAVSEDVEDVPEPADEPPVDEDIELDARPDEPPEDALDQLESSIESSTPNDDDSDDADEFISTDFDDETGDESELGAVSSGSLSAGNQDASLDEELSQVSAGGVGMDDDDGSKGMGDLLAEAPDDLGLGDISSADLSADLDAEPAEDDDSQDVPGLDRMSFPDALDVNSETLQTQAEIEDPATARSPEQGADDVELRVDKSEQASSAEGHAREKRSAPQGDADESDEDNDEADPEQARTATDKPSGAGSLKDKLRAALNKRKSPTSTESDAGEKEQEQEETGSPTTQDEDAGSEQSSTGGTSKRDRLRAALTKLGKRKKKDQSSKKSPASRSGSRPIPTPDTSSSASGADGADTPTSELGFDLGIGDDLADTLSRLMPDEDAEQNDESEEAGESATDAQREDKSLLIELVDVVDDPEEDDEEVVGPDPNFQSGDTLTAIRPMSLASEAEETPGLRMPKFGGEPDESSPEPEAPEDAEGTQTEESAEQTEQPEAPDESHDNLFADVDRQPRAADDQPTSERGPAGELEEPQEPELRESGDEVTPAGDIRVPDEARVDEDSTKQVSAADLKFIRSGAGRLGGEGADDADDGEGLAVPSLQSETESGVDGLDEPSKPSVVHSELADVWTGRSTAGVFGKGIIRPTPAEDAEFDLAKSVATPHRWVYGLGRLAERGLLCVCGGDATVSIFDDHGKQVSSLEVPEDGLNDIAVVALGSVVFAAGDDGFVYAWTLPDEPLKNSTQIDRAAVSGHDGWVTSLDVDMERQLLLSGSFDGTARLWALDGSADPKVLDAHDGAVSGVAFTERGPVTVGHDGTVRFWTHTGLQIDQLDGFGKVLCVKSEADIVAWSSADGSVNLRDNGGVRSVEKHDTQATCVAVDERGAIAAGDKRGHVRIYAPGADTPFQTLALESAVWAMDLTPSQLLVGTDDGKVRFFERP